MPQRAVLNSVLSYLQRLAALRAVHKRLIAQGLLFLRCLQAERFVAAEVSAHATPTIGAVSA